MPEPNGSRRHCYLGKEQRRPPPKRGIIKKRIFASIVKLFKRNKRQKEADADNGHSNDDRRNRDQQNGAAQTHEQ
ncbi:hypothetical protein ACJRO7_008776 [Eucalyptus globulus]|uniref:Uncharacterized protein n=1 Tax=Eucalyptus globulus TaxID=34317 RepID=A0ABD3ITA2_EUCGL